MFRVLCRSNVKTAFFGLTILLAGVFSPPAWAQQIEQAVEALTAEILSSLQAKETTSIAIVEFTDLGGGVTPLGRLIAEELTGQLLKKAGSRLKLVERSKLEEVLAEQRLGIRGLLEKKNLETYGTVLGVQAILSGTIALFEDRIRINARLMAVPSAEVSASASAYMGRLGLPEEYFRPERAGEQEGSATKSVGSRPAAVQEFKGIQYELLGCEKQPRLIVCRLVLTNNGSDRDYSLHVDWNSLTKIWDQRGHVFQVSRVRLADAEATDDAATKRLIAEIPTEARLFFEGVPWLFGNRGGWG